MNSFKRTENDISSNEGNTLFILGNGFDIDLGFHTSYRHFFLSEQFPFVDNDQLIHDLGHFVYNQGAKEKWYDLENILAEYGREERIISAEKVDGDKEDFKRLVQGLADYLLTIDLRAPKEESTAALLLRAADDPLLPPTVYTFNYTDFEIISHALRLGYSKAYHVHGSINNADFVLGAGEYMRLGPNASYLHKTSNVRYDSRGILNAISKYDAVIIFGLSLSRVDYQYFEDYFKDVANRRYLDLDRKFIRIFTYDEQSRQEILDNLRGMNSGLIKLMGYSDFDIVRTKDDIDYDKVQEVINYLSKRAIVGL